MLPLVDVDIPLIRRFDREGPRYTSYPTADRFTESFGPEAYESSLARRDIGGVTRPLALYVHLPFCSTVCFYCGCNKVVTRDRSKGDQYLRYLAQEIALQAAAIGGSRKVSQMHWGGGTPNFFTLDQVAGLYAQLRDHFDLDPAGEYSIELDPRYADADYVAGLRALGFNRLSLGVQDLDPAVQRAVHRVMDERQLVEIMDAARRHEFRSVNIDLIYGLPRQTLAGFEQTLERIIAVAPSRIAAYSYAHIPTAFKPQRRIREDELPAADMRLKLLAMAIRRLTRAGYQYIGMDHFARVGDALAVAQRQGTLHRNFQGYSTHAHCDLLALGVSAIGSIGPTYSQNHRQLRDYYDALDRNVLPVMRGIELTADDLLRRAVIGALMCQFTVIKESFAIPYLIDFDEYFSAELRELASLEEQGLVELDPQEIRVTPKGRLLVRNIAMVFDRYLREDRIRRSYSRVI